MPDHGTGRRASAEGGDERFSMFDLRPIGPSAFGAEIHGLNIGCELSDAVVGEIVDAPTHTAS